MTDIDFGRYSDDYVRHRPGFPQSFFDRIERIVPLQGVSALDLGTGPGKVAIELAARGANVIGLDISEAQIDSAKRQAAERAVDDRCDFHVAPAEDTQLPGASFDLVTAGQCWKWFDHDRALHEVHRVLKPQGIFIVAHYDYLTFYSDVVHATEKLVLEMNPNWTMFGHTGIRGESIDVFAKSDGFTFIEQFCYDEFEPFTHEGWRGRMRTCNGVGSGILTDEQVLEFDRRLAELLQRLHPAEPVMIPHRVWCVVLRWTDG
jgi:SAM-dependent methyltransferase